MSAITREHVEHTIAAVQLFLAAIAAALPDTEEGRAVAYALRIECVIVTRKLRHASEVLAKGAGAA